MAHPSGSHAAQVGTLVRSCPWFMEVLITVRDVSDELGTQCWVGAGVIRDLVWDTRYGRSRDRSPANFDGASVKDIDVVFFDPADLDPSRDIRAEAALVNRRPDLRWDATNQAAVHLWYEQRFGYPVEPLTSVIDGVATWPETATAVAVRFTGAGSIDIAAPLGLDDLINGVYRRNPRRVSIAEYRRRIQRKNPEARWPGVRVHPE